MSQNYIYKGLLNQIKSPPDPEELRKCPSIDFFAKELDKWVLRDHPFEYEWQQAKVKKKLINEGEGEHLLIEGDFNGIVRLGLLSGGSLPPSFWIPLSTMSNNVPHFPISSHNYPVVEITYKNQTLTAKPAWSWYYNTGQFFEFLPASQDWITVARSWSYNGFPRKMENFVFRLYSNSCSKESVLIKSIRFRDYTYSEREFLSSRIDGIYSEVKPLRYSLLEEFFPLGVYVKANTVKTMSNYLGIDIETYLGLLFEDVAQHYHNMVFFEDFYDFLPGDTDIVFEVAKKYGIRVVVALQEETTKLGSAYVTDFRKKKQLEREKDEEIKKYANNPAFLGWVIKENPSDEEIDEYLSIKESIEKLDSYHPVIYLTREANAFPIYASVSSVCGISHWRSKNPWELGQIIRTHYRLFKGQQLWIVPPAFVYGSGFPQWNSAPEIRLMLNLAISSGARGWLSYTYHNIPFWIGGECERSMTGPFFCSSDVWQELGSRLGRFFSLTPLFLQSVPLSHLSDIEVEVRSRKHPRSRCPESVEILLQNWFKGKDFWIFYLVNQDTSEVTGVDVRFRRGVGKDYKVYDVTHFVRTYDWVELSNGFHREMFPGQGLILLIAHQDVCDRWKEVIIERLIEYYEKQIRIDMELLKYYCTDLINIYEDKISKCLSDENPVDKLASITQIKKEVFNSIYGCESLVESRGRLFKVESLLCACDEEMSKLVARGKADLAESYRDKILSLAKEYTRWKLAIKRGEGRSVINDLDKGIESLLKILTQLRTGV